jgi:hypothetical protein
MLNTGQILVKKSFDPDWSNAKYWSNTGQKNRSGPHRATTDPCVCGGAMRAVRPLRSTIKILVMHWSNTGQIPVQTSQTLRGRRDPITRGLRGQIRPVFGPYLTTLVRLLSRAAVAVGSNRDLHLIYRCNPAGL